MKLIISEMEALSSYVSTEWHHVIKTLIDDYGWVNLDRYHLWNQPGALEDKLVGHLGRIPDTLLLWGGFDFAAAHIEALSRLDCYKGYFVEDLHKQDRDERSLTCRTFERCDVIFAAYANVLSNFYPDIANRKRVVWAPHSASPLFMLGFNDRAENSIFLSGAISNAYPLRQQMKKLCGNPAYQSMAEDRVRKPEGIYSIVYHPHPGYYCGYDYERDPRVGKGYAQKINRHRAGFTDALVYKYLVGKHFEIPATGALLLAERAVSNALWDLGFVEDVHYVSVSSEDMEEKIVYVLNEANHPELDQIRRAGQKLVWEKHTTSNRAKLIDDVCTQRP